MNKLPPKRPNEEPSNLGARRLRLPTEPSCPSLSKVRTLLEEAQGKRGTLIEMPWPDSPTKSFILTCQWDETLKDPVWTLYEEIDGTSKVVWTQPFAPQDLEFLYDILSMSAGGSTKLEIPDELKPRAEAEEAMGEPDLGGVSMAGGPGLGPALAPALSPMSPMSPMTPLVPLNPQQAPTPPGYPQNPLYAQQPTGTQTNMPPVPPGATYQGMPPYNQNQYPYQMPQQMGQPMPQQQMPQQMPQQMQPPMPQQQMPNMMPQGYQQQNNPYQQNPQQNQQQNQQHMAMNYGHQTPLPQSYNTPSYTQEMMEPKIPLDYHLIDKRANILIGTMLKEAGLISEPTLEAALKLQELVREEKMSVDKCSEVLKRLHAMGSSIDQYLTKGDFDKSSAAPVAAPPPQAKPQAAPQGQGRDLKGAFDILQKAQLLTESDLTTAMNVRKKHGGDIVQILEAAGKVNSKTVDAALTSLPLIREGLMKIEQVIMALNYCERMRVSFDDALEEMGWQNPRKLRTDLPL